MDKKEKVVCCFGVKVKVRSFCLLLWCVGEREEVIVLNVKISLERRRLRRDLMDALKGLRGLTRAMKCSY